MNNKLSWVDLPQGDFSQILGYQNEQIVALDNLMSAYHDLEKDDEDSLAIRVERLEDLIEYLQDWLAHHTTKADKLKHLITLKDIAEQKRNYLLALVKISQIEDMTTYLRDYHQPSNLPQSHIKHITLNPLRLYSVKKRAYWGDFWWVSLDPCHRQLTSYLMVWENSVKHGSSRAIDFFLWLETQQVPNESPLEYYYTKQDIERSLIKIQNGRLCTYHDGKYYLANFNKPNKKYLYVVSVNGSIHIAEEADDIYHSSFFSGQPVQSAGKINVVDGQVIAVSFESGHYIPSIKVGYQLFEVLSKQGAQLLDNVEVSYFYERNKYTTYVEKQFLQSFEDFEKRLESQAYAQVCKEASKNAS